MNLIKTGEDAGLYQITLLGQDGRTISLGRAEGIDKASQIHDLIAIALYGRHYPLNFSTRKYSLELFVEVLLTFQKLFPGELFWDAVKRGMEAGVNVETQGGKSHPVLEAYYKRQRRNTSEHRNSHGASLRTPSIAEWPPFCPPWMLPTHPQRKRLKHMRECVNSSGLGSMDGFPSWCDGSVTVLGIDIDPENANTDRKCSFSSCSMETLSQGNEEELSSGGHRVRNLPSNGVVERRVNEAFVPPKPVVEYDFMNFSQGVLDAEEMEYSSFSRRTRRGRSVRQPARYREDTIQLSDSDHGDHNPSGHKTRRAMQFATPVATQRTGEVKFNASRNVVALPHVGPERKVEAAAVVEDAHRLGGGVYQQATGSQLCYPFLKTIPSRNQ